MPHSTLAEVRAKTTTPRHNDADQLETSAAGEPTIFTKEFSLADRVALVTGGNRGLGLEMAFALLEAGCRAVYCVDLPESPGEDFQKARAYAAKLKNKLGEGRLEYVSSDVTNQVRFIGCQTQFETLDISSHRKQCGSLANSSETRRVVWTSPLRARVS